MREDIRRLPRQPVQLKDARGVAFEEPGVTVSCFPFGAGRDQ